MSGNLFILTGPSGVGKTTIAMELLARRDNLEKVVTCTTRPIRDGEVDGKSYHFLNHDVFQKLVDGGDMFEWDKHYDHLYGSRTSDVKTIIESGKDVLFVVDVQGAININKTNPEAIILFLEPESTQQLVERLQKRDGDDTAGFDERMKSVVGEMAFKDQADLTIINKDGALEQTVNQAMEYIEGIDVKS